MNDPNGLLVCDGVFHLFYQHDPDGIDHGTMHWGHATSQDLSNWQELPVALRPDTHGTCYSGSALRTRDGQFKLMYTAHRRIEAGRDFQTQCLVHANEALTEFVPDPGNPVLDNPDREVFRDPKIVWHAPTDRWIMAVTLGQEVGFYSSPDLANWQFESAFGTGQGRHGDCVWECPDLIEMSGPDGAPVWVLLVGLSASAYAKGSGTQYFIGTFDGHSFVNANPPETVLWFDYGRDFYAAQSFFDATGAPPLAMAWASNWVYARQTPTVRFRGAMSLPRHLRLVDTENGLRIAQSVPQSVVAAFDRSDPASGTFHRSIQIDLHAGKSHAIHLFGEAEPAFCIDPHGASGAILRTRRSAHPAMTEFAHDYTVVLPNTGKAKLTLEIFVDRGVVELFACEGLLALTNLFFPTSPEAALSVSECARAREENV